jgi:hypothetical protein
MPYSTLDTECLNTMQARTLEPQNNGASLTSTQWALADFINALNQAQNEWLRDTGCVVKHVGYEAPGVNTGIAVVPGTEAVGLPQDSIDILRAAWITYDVNNPVLPATVTDLPRDDAWSLDNLQSQWEENDANPPEEYTESISPVQQIYLAFPPSDIGSLDLLYVAIGAVLSNTGVALSVPDIGVSAVQWRSLELLLRKVGEAEDSTRADYCQQKYLEDVALAKAMLGMPYRIAAEG